MNINYPMPLQLLGLRALWKSAFDDTDSFLDKFFSTAFSPNRCRCVSLGGKVLAALYWFETTCQDRKFAYLSAVATDAACRNQGLCRRLSEDTKALLRAEGYAGILLVPEDEALTRMYAKMGFEPCTTVSECWITPGPELATIHRIDKETYALCRRDLLPKGAVVQEGENLSFLDSQYQFYSGTSCLAAVALEGEKLYCHELLGHPDDAPKILRTLGASLGFFRFPGDGKPFAMLCPLCEDCPKPSYFGLAFD